MPGIANRRATVSNSSAVMSGVAANASRVAAEVPRVFGLRNADPEPLPAGELIPVRDGNGGHPLLVAVSCSPGMGRLWITLGYPQARACRAHRP